METKSPYLPLRRYFAIEELDNGFLLTLQKTPLPSGSFPAAMPGGTFQRETYRTLQEALARIMQFDEAEGKAPS